MKEDCYAPDNCYTQLFIKNQLPYFHDLSVAFKRNNQFTTKDNSVFFKKVMNEDAFKRYINRI